ncbi:transcription termination factor NusA [Eggerthia catenaformis OT 569 = DSM 20559]|uniref:Transcription termination/antitermination protein NusA n=1 Tax=Eggerthia catenaformis OT 569 = DSM 20559 TaxID=999415 RepID=M2Q040_9FIRM|nr:transcription termination factor NusA [Eggerthia catenaformis]EMD16300.1 transcription termination factor NusA [Eggerthia catenaformis OT 569 = DSM 20559]OUC50793.1 transcription termination/antitermination protein NusA [Eggerthia catenaformis]
MAVKKTKAPKFIDALNLLEQERGIEKATVLDALKESLEKSYKKNYSGSESIVNVEIDYETGDIHLYEIKNVVDDVMDEDYELSEEEAKEINPDYKVGDQVITEVSPEVFGRLAAIQTKQLLRQKIREAEKEALYNEYVNKKDDIINGLVERVEPRFAIIDIGKTGALLPLNAQIPGEKLFEGQHLKVYVNDVERGTKGTHIGVSRVDPGLVKRLFEMNVPEIYDGTVEIKSVSREAGERSKIAVYTDNPNIDPIGSCVGPKGTRVRTVVTELNGEMIDIIAYDEDPILYISNALAPAKVTKVKINQKDNSALVIVPDDQLSLAIGKKGQNARLAVRLTGWKIDIKSVTEASEQGISYDNDESFNEELLEVFKPEEEINEEAFIVEESKQESLSEERQPKKAKKAPIKHETAESEEAIKLKEELENTENQDDDYVKVFTADEEIEEETEPEYDPKYDEDIDYDEYDKYYE